MNESLGPIIELSEVTKSYRAQPALRGVSLSVHRGVTGLLGPNGSGKSTLIKALLGLVRVDSGAGRVLGQPWPRAARSIRDAVGYLPEDDCYVAGLEGVETVQLAARLSGLPRREALRRAHEVLDFCDVGQERYRHVETYSTGMRQKLKFAQALVHDPQLVILDEPTTGLDPNQRTAFLNRIRTLAVRHGKTVLISTHILPDVRAVCDAAVILVGGRVRLADSLENLSRPAEPGLQVSVVGSAEALLTRARAAGVTAVAAPGGAVWMRGMQREDAARIWQWAAEVGAPIRRLEPARASLEQAFVDAVREDGHAHP